MKKVVVFIFMTIFLKAAEVDILANFNIEELPAKFSNVKCEFKINKTRVSDYFSKSAYDQKLKKISSPESQIPAGPVRHMPDHVSEYPEPGDKYIF